MIWGQLYIIRFSCPLRVQVYYENVFDRLHKAFCAPWWSRKGCVTVFPGLPPAAPVALTRNVQLIYPWLLGGLWNCILIGSIWEQNPEVIYNNHFHWLIIPRPNNPKTQFPTTLFIKVTDGQKLEKFSYNRETTEVLHIMLFSLDSVPLPCCFSHSVHLLYAAHFFQGENM